MFDFLCWRDKPTSTVQVRIAEHVQLNGPVKKHLADWRSSINEENVDILQTSARGENYLLTLEALHIREQKPKINTKDEYKSRELTIKI